MVLVDGTVKTINSFSFCGRSAPARRVQGLSRKRAPARVWYRHTTPVKTELGEVKKWRTENSLPSLTGKGADERSAAPDQFPVVLNFIVTVHPEQWLELFAHVGRAFDTGRITFFLRAFTYAAEGIPAALPAAGALIAEKCCQLFIPPVF